MSDELRAAAERWNEYRSGPTNPYYNDPLLVHRDVESLADAYLREHPADDDRTAVMLSEADISFLVRALQLAIPQTPSLEERHEFRDLILRFEET